jgi:N-acetylneuraminic acid mutarotase
MLTARRDLAVTTYDNEIYAIGGETSEGVTGAVERYDPGSNSWESLSPKPLPVADAGAAVVGGQIFVPGGRLASGEMTQTLEVYDPRSDHWEPRAAMPAAFSAYALAAFEGRLYLFGGWDGQHYLDSVYEYDPGRDEWTERTALPTPRAFAGAAVAGGAIYVVGGTAGGEPLAANEEYLPEADAAGENPWHKRADLPGGRSAMGIGSIADIIHIVGGQAADQSAVPLKYFPQQNEWQTFELPEQEAGSRLGLGVVEADLHVIGGDVQSAPTTQHLAYRAIYTVVLPIVQ